jgi:hypothetical protein
MTPLTFTIALLAGAFFAPAASGGPPMAAPPRQWDLTTPLFYLSDNAADAYTIADSFQHNFVLGQTGSGKSSTTARVLLMSMLQAGYGGLLTCIKTTDCAEYVRYARQAGREQDLIRVTFDDGVPFRNNFMQYEDRRSGKGVAEVLVHLFQNIHDVIERGQSHGGKDPFWRQSTNKLLRYGIILLRAAGEPLTIPNLMKLAVEAPTCPEEVDHPGWRERSFVCRCLMQADQAEKSAVEARDFDQAATYFLQEHARMGDTTRGSVLATFSGVISPFLTFPLRDLFQTSTNFVPEMCENGAIIILDMPVMGDYKELGQLAQVIFKMLWYRAMERRDVRANPRPCFFLSDEHQYIYSSHDQMFMTTARSLRVSCTLITQNISNFYAILPGDKGKAETDSLAANLGTTFYHMQSDATSNQWMATRIGTSRQWFQSMSTALPPAVQPLFNPQNPADAVARVTASMNQQESFEVPPQVFQRFRTGGLRHDRLVDALVFAGGRSWSTTGRPWLITTFQQEQ